MKERSSELAKIFSNALRPDVEFVVTIYSNLSSNESSRPPSGFPLNIYQYRMKMENVINIQSQ